MEMALERARLFPFSRSVQRVDALRVRRLVEWLAIVKQNLAPPQNSVKEDVKIQHRPIDPNGPLKPKNAAIRALQYVFSRGIDKGDVVSVYNFIS